MIEVYTDGASIGNPGPSGAGIVILKEAVRHEYSIPLGMMSNHEAEFQAIIKALEHCALLYPNEIISLRSDSQTAVETIEKEHTKNKTFQPLLEKIRELTQSFPYVFVKWIPEKQNKADILAKKAVQQV